MKISSGYSSCRTMLAMTVASIGRPLVKMPTWIGAGGTESVAVTSATRIETDRRAGYRACGVCISLLLIHLGQRPDAVVQQIDHRGRRQLRVGLVNGA